MGNTISVCYLRRPRPREAKGLTQGQAVAGQRRPGSPGSKQSTCGWYSRLQFRPMPSDEFPASLTFISLLLPHPNAHWSSCATHTHRPLHTFTPMFTTVASRRSKTREVTPSPRSLASQQLQRSVYLVPWVGTARLSSSTSQQLSGEAPSWPS